MNAHTKFIAKIFALSLTVVWLDKEKVRMKLAAVAKKKHLIGG
jgi:hypothetical protein